jgi:hypothetical protein
MILRSTSLFIEKKSENSSSVQESSARKRTLFLRFLNPRLTLSSKSLMLKGGDAFGGFRATLFFRVFKKPRNKRGEGGMGGWRLENS